MSKVSHIVSGFALPPLYSISEGDKYCYTLSGTRTNEGGVQVYLHSFLNYWARVMGSDVSSMVGSDLGKLVSVAHFISKAILGAFVQLHITSITFVMPDVRPSVRM